MKYCEENFKVVREQYEKGNIVLIPFDEPMSASLEEFIKQPADGILWDLNRGEEVTLSIAAKDETFVRWVNDFAAAKVIRALREKVEELEYIVAEHKERENDV